MNYNITVFRAEKRTLENPFAKQDEAKTREKIFKNPVFAFDINSEVVLTASELKTKIAKKTERQITFETAEIILEERTNSQNSDKNAYADDDLVEARDLIYTASIKR